MKLRPRNWGRTNFLLLQRGICLEKAVELMIRFVVKFSKLPLEFAAEQINY
jgi:hypothetical protein